MKKADHHLFIGLLAFSVVLIVLFSSTSSIFAKEVTVIDTELNRRTGNEQGILSKIDIGNSSWFQQFPKNISGWTSMDYDYEKFQDRLDADVLIMRRYTDPVTHQSVFFLITHSDNRSSFHPPIVCYPALGYTILDENVENVFVKNVSWAAKPLYSTWENKSEMYATTKTPMSVKKLELEKTKNGNVIERKVVLYFYVKDTDITSDEVTMVRVSSVFPTSKTYDESLKICSSFAGEVFPHLFEMQPEEPSIIQNLLNMGFTGIITLMVVLLMPLAIIIFPYIKRK